MDLRRLEVSAGPVPIVEGVRRAAGNTTGAAQFDFLSTGSLVYLLGPLSTEIEIQSDLLASFRRGFASLSVIGIYRSRPTAQCLDVPFEAVI